MAQRLIVGLHPNTDWGPVQSKLTAAGAEQVRGPSPELPDVLIVTIPSELNLEEFLRQTRTWPGVRYAEADTWQFSF